MKYLWDTNTCVRFINGRAPTIRIRLTGAGEQSVAINAIVKAEMYSGSAKSNDPARSRAIQEEFSAVLFLCHLMMRLLEFTAIFALIWKNKAHPSAETIC